VQKSFSFPCSKGHHPDLQNESVGQHGGIGQKIHRSRNDNKGARQKFLNKFWLFF
jgi:hypothetical protein